MENSAALTFSEEETVTAVPTHVKSMVVRNSHLYYLTPHLNGQWCGHTYAPKLGMLQAAKSLPPTPIECKAC